MSHRVDGRVNKPAPGPGRGAERGPVNWVQTLELFLPVQGMDVMIRRRKGERLIQIDWHPLARMVEPVPCDWGLGSSSVRLVCATSACI